MGDHSKPQPAWQIRRRGERELMRAIEARGSEVPHVRTVVIVGHTQDRVISARAVRFGNVGAIAGIRIINRDIKALDASRWIHSAASLKRKLQRLILRAAAWEVHDVGPDAWINSAKRGLLLSEDRARERSAERIRGVETMAREIGDAGARHILQIAIDGALRTGAGEVGVGTSDRRRIRRQRGINCIQFRLKCIVQRIQAAAIGEVSGVADMVRIDAQRKLGADLAYIVGGEYAASSQLALDSTGHVNDARRLVIRRQHTSEISQAVCQRVDVRTARHRSLRRHELRLQILNSGRDCDWSLGSGYSCAERLTANLRSDIKPVTLAYEGGVWKQDRSRRAQRQA